MRPMRSRLTVVVTVLALCMGVIAPRSAGAADGTASPGQEGEGAPSGPLTFPVAGSHSFVDTFGAPRPGGRTHHGSDIFADKLTPVVAVADGTVVTVATGRLAGRYLVVRHSDGWMSYYLHLNNDSPGTDDGLGGEPVAGIMVGASVGAGDVLDYVGDSGNAEGTPSHLHFELHSPADQVVNPYPYLVAARDSDGAHDVEADPAPMMDGTGLAARIDASNTELVGHFDPGGGFAAGLTVHDGVAYMGTWGRPMACPGTGVRVIDVAQPEEPALLAAMATAGEFPGTSTESVWVGRVDTDWFHGDLAVVAVRLCDNSERGRWRSGFRGLALYDVSDAAAPTLLGTLSSGLLTQGVHELSVAARDDGRLILAATVIQSLLHTEGALGDVRIVDISDPVNPAELADWDVRRDAPGAAPSSIEAIATEFHAHGATLSEDGKHMWVAHWDAGAVLLDIQDPVEPRFVTSIGEAGEGEEGNTHSVTSDPTTGLVIRSDQDLFPRDGRGHVAGWGIQYFTDASDPDLPIPIGTFATDRAVPDAEGRLALDGYYSAHEAVSEGDVEYVSWYSDGIRIVDFSDPTMPHEIGHFVPPASVDPQGYWLAPDGSSAFPMVWGVAIDGGVIYASDMHSGLWAIRAAPTPQDVGTDAPAPTELLVRNVSARCSPSVATPSTRQ